MYYVPVRTLPQSVLDYIRREELLHAGDRVGVAVSGGADSVALLQIMLELRPELGIVLSAVHFNHQLRGEESDADQQFVTQLAHRHQLELLAGTGDVAAHARSHHLSTEAAARQLRYRYFRQLFAENKLNRIATGHTLDDQAETVLLRVVRGAGTRGLAGIYPRLSFDASDFSVIRPLLKTRRKLLESYLQEIGQDWREDSSNRDLRHARNRVRHGIVPRLERTLNPAVRETLGETADIARSEEEYWQEEVSRALPEVWQAERRTLKPDALAALPLALRRRVVRAAAESLGLNLEFRHVAEILDLDQPGPRSAMLPGGWLLSASTDGLKFDLPSPPRSDYAYVLTVPGAIHVPEAGACFQATLVPASASSGYNPDHMLDPALLQPELTVRNWRAGDRYWPAHTKSPKKIKELLQERKLSGAERQLWPVAVSGQEIVWLRGFPTPARLRPNHGARQALLIRELPGLEDVRHE
ncbi:MAG TPA: tRNA lysidine(34) synthetase TilS [Terriglobales bacterium]|nr:tRNA lysidine(34) synthetase TilS [Terriglobales bacterium]